MREFFNPLMLSRIQFAITTLFHIYWPLLSIGLGLVLVLLEAMWLKTGKEVYYRHTRFWSRLFLLTFGIGVASGLPLEFQFGTNWARFSQITGNFFGNILGFEAAMAFMLEAAFLGIMVFGWNRVSRAMHMFSTIMVAGGAVLSAFWIMDASAWMQTPAGVKIENGQTVILDYWAAVFNPALMHSFTHMLAACIETSLFFMAGLSAWAIWKNHHREFFLKSFKLSLILLIGVAPLQIYLGDLSTREVVEHQPAKTAGMEAHWQTNAEGTGASWALAVWPDRQKQENKWEIRIPYVLSILSTHTLTGEIKGLREFAKEDQPPIVLPFYSFRIMTLIGFIFLFLMIWGVWKWYRGEFQNIGKNKYFWFSWIFSIPLGFIATDLGWIVRELGRQPWIIYNLMRTSEGVSNITVSASFTSLIGYSIVYLLLLIFYIFFTVRILHSGPDMSTPVPAGNYTGGYK